MSDTRATVVPIIIATYGQGAMTYALAKHLADKIDAYKGEERERMIMRMCWDWFSGGTTAESVARKIEEALP